MRIFTCYNHKKDIALHKVSVNNESCTICQMLESIKYLENEVLRLQREKINSQGDIKQIKEKEADIKRLSDDIKKGLEKNHQQEAESIASANSDSHFSD